MNMQLQGVQGEGGLSMHTLWMTYIITGFLNFIFDVSEAVHVFHCRAKKKIGALCLLESKVTKEKATQHKI